MLFIICDVVERLLVLALFQLLYYYSIIKANVKSLNFFVTRFLMKLFSSTNMNINNNCLLQCGNEIVLWTNGEMFK